MFFKIVSGMKPLLQSILAQYLQSDYDLHHQVHKMATEETLQYIKQNMRGSFCIKSERRETFFDYVIPKIKSEGSVLEFGVHKGRTLLIIAERIGNRICYGFDSFEGLTEDWGGRLFFPKKSFDVKGEMPNVPKNVVLHKGWFKNTIPQHMKENKENISFVHVDCDLYSSTKTVFDLIGNRIVPGTIILFDEYFNYPNWQENEFKAFKEFVEKNHVQYKYLAFTNDKQVCVEITGID